MVAGWLREVDAERISAERALASTDTSAQTLTEAEIRALVSTQRKVLRSLSRATSEQRATIDGAPDPDRP
jgi:hypothetical protein